MTGNRQHVLPGNHSLPAISPARAEKGTLFTCEVDDVEMVSQHADYSLRKFVREYDSVLTHMSCFLVLLHGQTEVVDSYTRRESVESRMMKTTVAPRKVFNNKKKE
ncbi:hypothetical protein RUM44_004650 [Polyplax serrata]|uniref:Uncharacterized protein n=1 Tax=Polyplax serrata TaxID=468196 RepID=A0ABR1B3G4_POLSC